MRTVTTTGIVLSIGISLITVLGLGCASPARTVSEPVALPDTFTMAGEAVVPERWWTVFEDDALNAVVDTALMQNYDLRAAWERLRAARAVTDRQAALLLPAVEATASGESTRPAEDDPSGDFFQAGLSASYEVDLWGRIRASVQAEQFRAGATRADYQAAALSLSAEIVRTWVQLAEAQSQLALVDEQIETNLTVLQLIENRFGLGQVRAVDILRQRQLVESTRGQRVVADARRQVLVHQLAVLTGRPPQQPIEAAPGALPALPPLPNPGVPLDLVQRRPDVQRAFLVLQAADRDVAAAISNQFPRITLAASVNSSSRSVQNLFQDWATTFAGNLLAPLFYGGELRAEVKRTEAVAREQLYSYGQTVLNAFQEVEDALVLEARQRDRITLLETQLTLADQTFEQLRVQYLNGTSNYLDVLTALDDVQALRRDLLTSQLALVEYRLGLYRALAGSIDTVPELES